MRHVRTLVAIATIVCLGAVSAIAPAAAQEDYEAALASGNLESLLPADFDAIDVESRNINRIFNPTPAGRESEEAARAELLEIVEATGVAQADTQEIGGILQDGDTLSFFTARRIPGVAAVDWFEPLYVMAIDNSIREPVRDIVEIGPKQVLRITNRGSDRSVLAYAQGEVLWIIRGDSTLGLDFLGAVESVEGPALSTDPLALVDGEPAATIGTADDPLSQIPETIMGAATETQTFPMAALFEQVDPDDAEAVAQADAIRSVVEAAGGIDKATFITSLAVDEDGGVSVVGIHVEGADLSDVDDVFIEVLLSDFDEPEVTEEQLGGKTVLRVSDAESVFAQPAYVYGVGGTVWVLRGDDEYIAALLRTMP